MAIKVCVDPCCEAVFHNIEIKDTRCHDCGSRLVKINKETWQKKFAMSFFQYDAKTGEYYRPFVPHQLEMAI